MSGSVWSSVLSALCALLLLGRQTMQQQQHGRAKRFLIFPRQSPTRHQFIAGIGIPADLSYESLTIGHVLKAEFFLPYNATVYRQNPFWPEYKFNTTHLNWNSSNMRQLLQHPTQLRWHMYAYIEHTLDSYGYNGHQCLMQAICEANSIRFARHYSVAAELVHLMLCPSSTLNADFVHAGDFLAAEIASDCATYDCNMKLLNLISQVLQLKV